MLIKLFSTTYFIKGLLLVLPLTFILSSCKQDSNYSTPDLLIRASECHNCYRDTVESIVHYPINFYIDTDQEAIYHWDFGDNTYSSRRDPSHVYTQSGTYKVIVTIETSKGINNDTIHAIIHGDIIDTGLRKTLGYRLGMIDGELHAFIIDNDDTRDVFSYSLNGGKSQKIVSSAYPRDISDLKINERGECTVLYKNYLSNVDKSGNILFYGKGQYTYFMSRILTNNANDYSIVGVFNNSVNRLINKEKIVSAGEEYDTGKVLLRVGDQYTAKDIRVINENEFLILYRYADDETSTKSILKKVTAEAEVLYTCELDEYYDEIHVVDNSIILTGLTERSKSIDSDYPTDAYYLDITKVDNAGGIAWKHEIIYSTSTNNYNIDIVFCYDDKGYLHGIYDDLTHILIDQSGENLTRNEFIGNDDYLTDDYLYNEDVSKISFRDIFRVDNEVFLLGEIKITPDNIQPIVFKRHLQ
ncbi:MAG: PKD domain-containing protein [Bacteroidales bacterium]|nr:PKD domain-containing protein [Bacteroidales bacterium]